MARPRANATDEPTLNKIFAAAMIEFGRVGFSVARLEDIASAVGIKRSSLLYHWPTKKGLYEAVIHDAFYQLGIALAGAMAVPKEFPERLDLLVEHFTSYLTSRPGVAPLILREVIDGDGPGHALLVAEVGPLLGEVEKFLRASGKGYVRPRLPLRAVLMQVVSSILLRAAAQELAEPLWGPKDMTRELTRLLVLEEKK